MKLDELEALYKQERKSWSEEHRICIHRAVSWLKSAEKYSDDPNISFMSVINAANACWGELQVKDADAIMRLSKNLEGTKAMKSVESIFRSADGSKWLTMLFGEYDPLAHWRYLEGEMDLSAFNQKAASSKQYAIKAIKTGKYAFLLKSLLMHAWRFAVKFFMASAPTTARRTKKR